MSEQLELPLGEMNQSLSKPSLSENIPDVALPNVKSHEFEDTVAGFFKKNKDLFELQIKGLSAKQLRRTILLVAAYPLIEPNKTNLSPEEKNAANTFGQMIELKTVMRLIEEDRKLEKAKKESVPQQTETGENNV